MQKRDDSNCETIAFESMERRNERRRITYYRGGIQNSTRMWLRKRWGTRQLLHDKHRGVACRLNT